MDIDLIGGVAASGIIIGLVQLAKTLGFPTKYAGLLAVGLGLLTTFIYDFYSDTRWYHVLVLGLAVGLSAAGLWSTIKSVTEPAATTPTVTEPADRPPA